MTLLAYVACGSFIGFIFGSIAGSLIFRRRVCLPSRATMRRKGPVIRLFHRARYRRFLRNYRRRVPYVYYENNTETEPLKTYFN